MTNIFKKPENGIEALKEFAVRHLEDCGFVYNSEFKYGRLSINDYFYIHASLVRFISNVPQYSISLVLYDVNGDDELTKVQYVCTISKRKLKEVSEIIKIGKDV